MIRRSLQSVSASIHQRLLNIAKQTNRPFNELLQYFAMERFLLRLSRSPYADSFVLKGALLFRVWDTPDSRATRDIDFMAYVDNSPKILANIVRDICTIADPNDKPLAWLHGEVKTPPFSKEARLEAGFLLRLL